MDLNLSEAQRELRSGLRDYLVDAWSPARLRAAADSPAFDRKAWQELAELGLFGLLLPEDAGGMGLGWADAVILFEELGRSLVPGPLATTLLAATLVPDAVEGVVEGGVILAGVDTRDPHAVVEYPSVAAHLLVVDDAGLFRRPLPPELPAAARPLDPLTPVALLPREQADPRGGVQVGSARDAYRWRLAGTLLTAALQVGVGQGALDLAVRYAGEREQFNRPIGSFQAVKHLLAEVLVRVDLARAATLVAGVALDDPGAADPRAAVAAAKALADEAATGAGRTGVQVHGGMGFTWEVLAHLHLKRAWLWETAFGSADEHAAWLADHFQQL